MHLIFKNLVPRWALGCTLKTLPGTTVQYLSDSGAVELSRECNGVTKEITCQGRKVKSLYTILEKE